MWMSRDDEITERDVLQNLKVFFIQSFPSRATPHLVQVGTETKSTESASTTPGTATVNVQS